MARKSLALKNFVGRLGVGLLKVLSWLPLPVAQFLGKLTGRLMSITHNKQRSIAQANLAAVYPELSKSEHAALAKSVLQHNAQSLFELGAMWFWSERKLDHHIRKVHGAERLQTAFDQGKGVIVLAPHIGNWEMVGNYLAIHYPSTFMYQPPKLQPLDKPIQNSRMRFGAQLAPTDLCGVKKVIKALKSNQVTGILPDQDAGANGVHAPFMGHPARTMTLVSRLLQKTQAACLFGVALRQPDGHFELHFLPANRQQLASSDGLQATTALNQGIEQCIELAPEQYLWCYRRYRGLPENYPEIYPSDKG